MPQLQQGVLFSGCIGKAAYGDHVVEIKFQQPVQITSISITASSHAVGADKTMFRGGWARDLFSAAAARFVPVLAAGTAPSRDVAALEAFATDHLVLHGKFHSVLVTVSGYVLAAAAEQIQAAAQAQLELTDLPPANPVLQLPTSLPVDSKDPQQQDQQTPTQLQLSPAPLLPLAKLPAVFIRALGRGVEYWRQVRLSHSRIEFNPPNGRLDQLTALADAVLAAVRGHPGALHALISSTTAAEDASAASSWSSVSADALDMSASWCTMLASCRTHTPFDMEVGVAGLAASILLASCTTTAAQFLAITDARMELAGATAVRGVICTPNAPPLISRYGLGLLELLLSSCPAVACATLLGPYTPAMVSSKQQQQQQQPGIKEEPDASRDLQMNDIKSDRVVQVKQEGSYSSGVKQEASQYSQHTAGRANSSGRRQQDRAGDSGRSRHDADHAAAGTARQQSRHADLAPPPPPSAQDLDHDRDHSDLDLAIPDEYDGANGGYNADLDPDDDRDHDDDDGDGLYDELLSDGQQQQQHDVDIADGYDDLEGNQAGNADNDANHQYVEGASDDEEYADLAPEQSEENLQLDGDEDDAYGAEGEQDYAIYDDVHDHQPEEEGQLGAAADTDPLVCDDGVHCGSEDDQTVQDNLGSVGSGDVDVVMSEQRQHSHGTASTGPYSGSSRGAGTATAAAADSSRPGRSRHSDGPLQQQQEHTADHDHVRSNKAYHESMDRDHKRYHWNPGYVGGKVGRAVWETEAATAAAHRQGPQMLARHRAQVVELYSGVVALAMQPRREDVAESCATVLRRLKCWECISVLRTTLGPMIEGSVNALLLPTHQFQQQMHKVTTAVADLADLVLAQPSSGPMYHSGTSQQQQQSQRRSEGLRLRQADVFVLQLLLSYSVFELLAALVDLAAIHGCRLAQQQQTADDQQQQHPSAASQQLSALQQEQSQLLASIQVLISSLTSTAAGCACLRSAGSGLAALAQAVNPNSRISLDGGALDISNPVDPAAGRPLLRHQLLLGSCGPGALGAGAATADLALGLQRILLVAKAAGQLQQQGALGSSIGQSIASSGAAAAVQTLVQCCMSSPVGREAVVCALASCPPALKHLVSLLGCRARVLTTAAGSTLEQQQDEAGNELAGLLLDADDDPLAGDFGAGSSGTAPKGLAYESLYIPDLLLAVLSDPHPDIMQQWITEAGAIAAATAEELKVQDRHAAAAAAAAFPAGSNSRGADDQVQGSKGLDLTVEANASSAVVDRQRSVLLQLQGRASAAQQLTTCWKCGDGSGSGSGAALVTQLQQVLPPLVVATSDAPAAGAAGLTPVGSGGLGDLPAAAADGNTSIEAAAGAAAVSGAPPPWGKDVKAAAAVQFVISHQDIASAVSSLQLMTMLLQGPSTAVRQLVAAAADRPAERSALQRGLNPAVALNPNGALGPGGSLDHWSGVLSVLDGLAGQVLVAELLEAGVLDVLDRGLRVATCALEASTSDFLWGLRGGDCMDDLERLRGRSAAASLLLAAASAAAALMLLLAEAEVTELSACSLLDAIVCAHTAVVTSQEGLAATLPTPALTPLLAAAADPTSTAAAAAAATAARSGAGRCHDLLLQARQQLAVCLCCWQKSGWWPDCVGALLGHYPSASEALQQIAAEETEARAKGELSAPPRPAPRQGPRQLLAALLALGDVCPPEWPPPGASQQIAAAADEAAAAGRPWSAVAFSRPTHMQLRSKIAGSCECHMAALAELVSWGAAVESKLVRAALVRLCVKAGSLGGGMSPFLIPLLLEVLREQLDAAIKAQQQIKAQMAKMAAAGQGAAAQQRALQAALPNAPQLSDGRKVIELLIPLASKPGFKAALLEHKVVGMLAKYLHKLATKSKEDSQCHPVAGLVLQLLAALGNPDVSMAPNAPRTQREQEDTPLLRDARDMVTAILASAHLLDADNMAAAASLLVGPCAAAGGRGLAQYSRGQAALRQGALRWFQSQAPDAANYLIGNQFTADAIPAAISWAANRLTDAAEQSTEPSHKSACIEIAAALRQLPTNAPPDTELEPAGKTIMRFAKAVQESVGAASAASAAACEDLGSILQQPAVLLACDPVVAEFLAVSSVGQQQLRQKRIRPYGDKLASDPTPLSSLFGGEGLVPPKRLRTLSRPVQWLQSYVAQQAHGGAGGAAAGRQLLQQDNTAAGGDEVPEGVPNIPVVMAPRRSATVFRQGSSSRKASLHVDDYQSQQPPPFNPAGSLPPSAAGASGVPMMPGPPLIGGRQTSSGGPSPTAAAAVPGQHGGPPRQGSGRIMRPDRPVPTNAGAGFGGPGAEVLPGPPVMRGMAMAPGMLAGLQPGLGGGMVGMQGASRSRPQIMPAGAPGMPLQQRQQKQGPSPSDPRQQQAVRQRLQAQQSLQQQQQQQQQQGPPLTDLRRSESPSGGSDLLGGLAGDSPDYGDGRSPSYHSSPDSVGAEVEGNYMVTYT